LTKLSHLGIYTLAGLLGLAGAVYQSFGQAASEPISVIELFTSQGCSSCPPADRLLQEFAQRPDVIALSFPVAYWDYLGWKDTLARPEFAERQRQYASIQGDGQVYTPEAVVNGLQSCVGSNRGKIESALRTTLPTLRKDAVSLTARRENGRLIIEAGAASPGSEHRTGRIWVASVRHSTPVAIGRGENAGRIVTYTNIVRNLTDAGEWQGAPASYAVPLGSLAKDGDMFVVFLQTENLGPIVAAARIKG
jgi:hypothetical protein